MGPFDLGILPSNFKTPCVKLLLTYKTNQNKFSHMGKLTLRGIYYNQALGQEANLFIKVILCIQGHAAMFVQVYMIVIISLVNGLIIFRSGRSGVMTVCQAVEEVIFKILLYT